MLHRLQHAQVDASNQCTADASQPVASCELPTLRPSHCRLGGSPCASRVRTWTRCCNFGKACSGAPNTKPAVYLTAVRCGPDTAWNLGDCIRDTCQHVHLLATSQPPTADYSGDGSGTRRASVACMAAPCSTLSTAGMAAHVPASWVCLPDSSRLSTPK